MPQSPEIMAFGTLRIFLPETPDKLCDRKKLVRQEKQAGNNSDIFFEEIVAIADKILESKKISTKQHKFFLHKCFNQMKTMKLTVKS